MPFTLAGSGGRRVRQHPGGYSTNLRAPPRHRQTSSGPDTRSEVWTRPASSPHLLLSADIREHRQKQQLRFVDCCPGASRSPPPPLFSGLVLRGKVQRDFRNGGMTRFLRPWRLVCLLWISQGCYSNLRPFLRRLITAPRCQGLARRRV